MSKHRHPRDESRSPIPAFDPVIVRSRHDGWTADTQLAFIQALAECGCVSEACERVGKSTNSAYALRARVDAQSFRYAWEAALDHAVRRLSDAAFARALHGVARPVFFQGEQIGERRHFDERLAMFLLRYRDPVRYGKWNDQCISERAHPDGTALLLGQLLLRLFKDGQAFDGGEPPPDHGDDQPFGGSIVEDVDHLADRLAESRRRIKEEEDED